jgi:hypothetical protein
MSKELYSTLLYNVGVFKTKQKCENLKKEGLKKIPKVRGIFQKQERLPAFEGIGSSHAEV